MTGNRCPTKWCRREHVHIAVLNGEMILVRGPRPYLKIRDNLLKSGMVIEHRGTLRRLANAILRELDSTQLEGATRDGEKP